MPQPIETSAGYRARINMRVQFGLAIPCIVLCILIDGSGYLPAPISNGLWWEIPALAICIIAVMKTK